MSNPDDDPSTRIIAPTTRKTVFMPDRAEVEFDPTQIAPAPPSGDFDRTQAASPPAFGDDERTVRASPPPPSPPAGHDSGGNMLPVGTYLAEFEITKVIGEGGFGIVYLAQDHSLGRRVALKEYMPSSLAQRIGGTHVSVKSERHRETFEAGLKSFVNEARLLAQFDHPSLVKVYRFWEAHGTAYMVMPFYEGITLKDQLKSMAAPPDEAWLRNLLEPLTEALAVIHAEQCFHRDIAPDNVILLKGSNLPLLLDFGAARRVIGDMTQALTVILKPGYAPVEQYAEVPGMKQGPWTDVYALAAVVYYAIQGKTPPTSVARLMNDHYVPMAQIGAGRYAPGFLAAIDRALAVRPEQRTQSIDALRKDLGMAAAEVDGGEAPVTRTRTRARVGPTPAPALPPAVAAARRSRSAMFAGIGLVAVLAAVGIAYALFGGKTPAEPASATTSTTKPALASASGSVNVAATSGAASSLSPASSAAVAGAATTEPAVGATVQPPAPGPFDPQHEFERVVAAQSPDFTVFAAADKPQLRINKDEMRFQVKTEKEGYMYVFQFGSDGNIVLLFPNGAAKSNLARADTTVALPPAKAAWNLPAGGPPGIDRLLAIVSRYPRDFSALHLKSRDGFSQTTAATAKTLAETWTEPKSIFAGKPICKDCTDEYGASTFSAEEVR